jgi:hypothetical protein
MVMEISDSTTSHYPNSKHEKDETPPYTKEKQKKPTRQN